jgi:hypothetical protein
VEACGHITTNSDGQISVATEQATAVFEAGVGRLAHSDESVVLVVLLGTMLIILAVCIYTQYRVLRRYIAKNAVIREMIETELIH